MNDLLAALCLVLVIEGLLLWASPAGWRRLVEQVRLLPDSSLRRFGAGIALAGLLLLQLVR